MSPQAFNWISFPWSCILTGLLKQPFLNTSRFLWPELQTYLRNATSQSWQNTSCLYMSYLRLYNISCCCEVIHEGTYWWLIDPWLNPWPSCLPFGRSGQYPHSHYKQDIGELEIVHPVVTMGWNRQQWPGSVFIRNNSWQSPAHLQVHGIALLLTRSACWGHIFRRWLGPFCCKILFSIMSWISTLVCSMHPENTAMSAFCMNVSIYQLC